MDWYSLLISSVTGCLLGIAYFGGLWLTVKKIVSLSGPTVWIWVTASYLLRTAVVLWVFYQLSIHLHWNWLVVALLFFVLTRQLIIKKTGRATVLSNT